MLPDHIVHQATNFHILLPRHMPKQHFNSLLVQSIATILSISRLCIYSRKLATSASKIAPTATTMIFPHFVLFVLSVTKARASPAARRRVYPNSTPGRVLPGDEVWPTWTEYMGDLGNKQAPAEETFSILYLSSNTVNQSPLYLTQ
jgi:hypothetical protein